MSRKYFQEVLTFQPFLNYVINLCHNTCIMEKECKVERCIIPIDFATQDNYQKITSSMEGLDIGILGEE